MRALTERQARFVERFLYGQGRTRFNATRAAQEAGYAWPDKQGPRLLSFPHVKAVVDSGFAEILRRVRPGLRIIGPNVHVGKSR
jgi:phage terminase small subunit